MREQRPFEEAELARAGRAVLLDDVGAGDVGRHQVGRELDAAERQVQRAGQRADQQRLGQTRHAFQQAVAAAEQGDQQFLDHVVLADDHLRKLVEDLLAGVAQLANGRRIGDGGLHDISRPLGASGMGHSLRGCESVGGVAGRCVERAIVRNRYDIWCILRVKVFNLGKRCGPAHAILAPHPHSPPVYATGQGVRIARRIVLSRFVARSYYFFVARCARAPAPASAAAPGRSCGALHFLGPQLDLVRGDAAARPTTVGTVRATSRMP